MGSSFGIVPDYELDGQWIESRWGEIFRTCPVRPWGPPSLLYNGYRVFPGIKERPGVTLAPHPLLVPWSRKSRAITLLPLWFVLPVQSLSACTRAHFTFLPETLSTLVHVILRLCALRTILRSNAVVMHLHGQCLPVLWYCSWLLRHKSNILLNHTTARREAADLA